MPLTANDSGGQRQGDGERLAESSKRLAPRHGPRNEVAIDSRFLFESVHELLSSPPPTWLVEELIDDRGFAVLYGPSGGGKSFAAIDLSCAIVRGVPWFGLSVKQGAVAYVAAEGRLSERIRAYLQYHELSPEALEPLRILSAGINLLAKPHELQDLIDSLRAVRTEFGGLALVVIDTLNAAMPGGNENSPEDMGNVIATVRRIGRALDSAVLLVHHSGKNEERGSRGHSSLKAALDTEIRIERRTDGTRVLHAEKVRDGEEKEIGAFVLEKMESGERCSCVVLPCDAPKRSKAPQRRIPPMEQLALSALHELLGDAKRRREATSAEITEGARQWVVSEKDWRAKFYSRHGDNIASARQAFNRVTPKLEEKGKVQQLEEVVWLKG